MNYYKNFDFKKADSLIKLAITEDLGKGDITSNYLIPDFVNAHAELLAKENGYVAGLTIFKMVFDRMDKKINIKFSVSEGVEIKQGNILGEISGNTKHLLAGERIALNILQRMSGIATYTRFLSKKLNNKSIKITDTRKTTPNFRLFEKLAVKIGGGENHRFGLFDMILIKDNHIEACGGLENTLKILKKKHNNRKQKIEIEVKTLDELEQVIMYGRNVIDRVMLDNFEVEEVLQAVKINNRRFKIEISGGITQENISNYSSISGVNYISIGSLTHSFKSLDIALNFTT